MGAIASSKQPRTIRKRDGAEPVKLYKEGGGVNAAGKQFVAQPKEISQKTRSFRNMGK
jgi:hypothetical protein